MPSNPRISRTPCTESTILASRHKWIGYGMIRGSGHDQSYESLHNLFLWVTMTVTPLTRDWHTIYKFLFSRYTTISQLNIMDMWKNKTYFPAVLIVLAATSTLCTFKSLIQVKKPTPGPDLVRSEYISLSLIDLTQGRVNIFALSVIRSYIMDDASKGWRPNQV